jgi:6-phosphofructokinase 1
MQGNAVIGQSGGPTVVINQSLVGCIEGLKKCGDVKRILGARHAVSGIVKEDFIDLTDVPEQKLERLALSPAAALLSSRDKPDEEYCQRIFSVFEKHDVHYFFYIGGNDSSDTCRIVNEVAKKSGYELRAFHIPKTIDNDLMENDHTPGYPSAAKFVASAFMGDNLDNRALSGIKINVVMGRHAGFLTGASIMARIYPGDGPHLVYVPERPLDVDTFVGDVDRMYTKYGRCVVAVSEGVHDENGTPMATLLQENVEKDAHGNVQLSGTGALGDHLTQVIKDRLGATLRVRADTFGYLQRSFPDVYSEVDRVEARAVGRIAAEQAAAGVREGSIAIRRASQRPYRASFDVIDLKAVAGLTRVLSDEFISTNGHDMTDAFWDYLAPLIGELPVIDQIF